MSTPVINAPEVAIVGVNKVVQRPVYVDGQFVPRQLMNLSSSFDHRVVDGADAAEFIQTVKWLQETPGLLFARFDALTTGQRTIAATASWSTSSFIGSPPWPLTQPNVTSCRDQLDQGPPQVGVGDRLALARCASRCASQLTYHLSRKQLTT